MRNPPVSLVKYALVAIHFEVIGLLNHHLVQGLSGKGGRVWAIGPRLMVSNAHKSAGTNTPNPAGDVMAGEDGCKVVFWAAMGRQPTFNSQDLAKVAHPQATTLMTSAKLTSITHSGDRLSRC